MLSVFVESDFSFFSSHPHSHAYSTQKASNWGTTRVEAGCTSLEFPRPLQQRLVLAQNLISLLYLTLLHRHVLELVQLCIYLVETAMMITAVLPLQTHWPISTCALTCTTWLNPVAMVVLPQALAVDMALLLSDQVRTTPYAYDWSHTVFTYTHRVVLVWWICHRAGPVHKRSIRVRYRHQ